MALPSLRNLGTELWGKAEGLLGELAMGTRTLQKKEDKIPWLFPKGGVATQVDLTPEEKKERGFVEIGKKLPSLKMEMPFV